MKKTISIIVSSIISYTVTAQITNQKLFDTIPFIPDHYAQLAPEYAQQPVITGKIIFLGNSITEMGKWKDLLRDSTVINRGIGGDITFGVLKRLDDVIKRQPSKLFLLIGINDIGKDIPDAVIANNIRKIVEQVKHESPQTKIFLETILPVNPDINNFPQHYDKNEHVVATNELIKKVATETNVTLIDTYSLFADPNKKLKKEYTLEGLHLNDEGYKMWVNFLKEKGYL